MACKEIDEDTPKDHKNRFVNAHSIKFLVLQLVKVRFKASWMGKGNGLTPSEGIGYWAPINKRKASSVRTTALLS